MEVAFVIWMLQTYTTFTLLGGLALTLRPLPLFVHKIVGVNVMTTCFTALLRTAFYSPPLGRALAVRSFYIHGIPLVPTVIWFRHAEAWARNAVDLPWVVRTGLNGILFGVWCLIPYRGRIFLSKINTMYHDPEPWLLGVMILGWCVFQRVLGRASGSSVQEESHSRGVGVP